MVVHGKRLETIIPVFKTRKNIYIIFLKIKNQALFKTHHRTGVMKQVNLPQIGEQQIQRITAYWSRGPFLKPVSGGNT